MISKWNAGVPDSLSSRVSRIEFPLIVVVGSWIIIFPFIDIFPGARLSGKVQ